MNDDFKRADDDIADGVTTSELIPALFGALNTVSDSADRMIALLPGLNDEELEAAEGYTRDVGAAAWRVQLAIRAEIVERIKTRAWKRGSEGAVVAISVAAKDLGLSQTTLYRDAQIHNTFFSGANTENIPCAGNVLDDKEFYKQALLAPNPHTALAVMADKKHADPSYSTRDARADVIALKRPVFASPLAFPDGIYPLILADPPWQYDFSTSTAREVENKYPTMTVDEICALPVTKITATDSVLFLWATAPKLIEALTVIAAWGFTYKTQMVWDKEIIGMGYYVRGQHELLLIATKGNPPTPCQENRPSSVIRARRRAHSVKPDESYQAIERMYPTSPKVELFCRLPRNGWSNWGNQV